ncbi:MAG: DUF424 family protein [Thermoplasmata archaeon]|nr:DUF424 family protein [Thermoplasmata archaeon]
MNQNTENSDSLANKIYIKVYTVQNEVLVAACDAELIGKTLKEGEIEFHVSKEFYADVLGDEELLKKHLVNATIANLVGHRAVKCGIEVGIIDKENVIKIAGIPHAQFALL